MADWMGRLPSSVKKKAFSTLCIPGSHDSGAFWFNMRLGLAHDQSFMRYLRHIECMCVKRIVRRWAITQTMNITEQLLTGIRFLDIRLELGLDNICNAPQANFNEEDASRKGLFIVHGLYGTDWLKIVQQIVDFLAAHPQEVVIINVSHVYRVSEFDFRRFFLHPLAMNAARNGVFLCDTLVDLRTISLEELLENQFRLVVVGPTDADVDRCCFRSSAVQNKWPEKNRIVDLLSFMQAQIHAPVTPGIRVLQGVLTPKLSDIFRNIRKTLRKAFSLPCRGAVKEWLRDLDEEEIDHLNVCITDQVDTEFCRLVYNLNVAGFPGHKLDGFGEIISRDLEYSPELEQREWIPISTYPTPPESDKKGRSLFPNIPEEDEPEILIEEIFEDEEEVPPRKPLRASVMIQQIEMVLDEPSSPVETIILTPSPVPPPKPKRFSHRIPIVMEVEPIPDDAVAFHLPDAPTAPLSRSSDTPVRIALPVTDEELRLAALGEYPRYGSQRSARSSPKAEERVERVEKAEKKEEVTVEPSEADEEEEHDECAPLITQDLSNMVEDLVIHSTLDAMDNLADRFKASSSDN